MKVKFFGTRGSIPICNPKSMNYGGNTTCLRVISECIPKGWALVVDTGSGYVPLSLDLIGEKIMNVAILYTHWHHDHTQGLCLAPHTFIPKAQIKVWGPHEHGIGPVRILTNIMQAPVFPVEFVKLKHRFECNSLKHIGTQVLIVHPTAGFQLMDLNRYRSCVYEEGKQLKINGSFQDVKDCLVIFMYKTDHPEYSVSYRFQEKPTGKSFVFLTDHENTASISNDLLLHVKDANLLVQDSQYSDHIYRIKTSGFGHGTPEYCADLMHAAKVNRLGLTHHDPFATDDDVNKRVSEAKVRAKSIGVENAEIRIFACADYMEVEV